MPDTLQSTESPASWILHMRRGEFEKAWKFSDAVIRSGLNRDYHNTPRHYQCIWNGTPLEGKRVLVRCYHGLGDTIMFIRYAALLKHIATEVLVWAQPELLEVLSTAQGIDRLLPLHDGVPDIAYDVDVEIMELPHVFRTTLSSIPIKIPYLHVNPLPLPKNEGQMKVGLVWQAGDWDQSRNVPFPLLKHLAGVEGVSFYILQFKAISAGWDKRFGIHLGELKLTDYARAIRAMNLVISVDSMPAHLAGALNVPVWLMLQAQADWRWMENRTDSPWYPSMKLFRQPNEGNWEAVIMPIAEELKSLRERP
jgi:hypothetical protein